MKKILLALSLPYLLSAHTLPELFHALQSHAQTKADTINVERATLATSQVTSSLYPKIALFATYDNFSDPTGMIPIAPKRIPKMGSQPFGYNIYKSGLKFSMPLFVKSIYTMAEKTKAMQKSAKAKKRINLLQNEAIIVGSNANLLYLDALTKSLNLKEKSLLETQKTLKIKVENGRAPASSLYKIDDGLNQISIAQNNIALQKRKLISQIETLTGIKLTSGIIMHRGKSFTKGAFQSLQPLQEKIKATQLDLKAQKERLYPSVVAHGSYSYDTTTAYNTEDKIDKTYGDIGIAINIPLLEMTQSNAIKEAKVALLAQKIALEKANDILQAKADMLNDSLPLLERSIELSKRSIENKQKLLKIAKVNYRSGRLSTEEYLRYEDDVVGAKAKLYQAKAQRWQTVMELAVIYANNIEEIVE